MLPRAALQVYVDVGQVAEEAVRRFLGGSGEREDIEWAAGALFLFAPVWEVSGCWGR